MPKLEDVHINPLGFREYDARWLYPKDINKAGIKNVGQGLGSQIILRTNKSPREVVGHDYRSYSDLWFMPATPILSNGGTERGLPISCFLNEAGDSLDGILDLWNENVWLAAKGGGIGSYWGNLRSIGEKKSKKNL